MGKQIQVVDEAGCYQEEAVLDFVRSRGIAEAGVKYSTVAIMGPQSSGKSTLLNHLVRLRLLPLRGALSRVKHARCKPCSSQHGAPVHAWSTCILRTP